MSALLRDRPDRWIRLAVLSAAVCVLVYQQPFRLVVVHGNSMQPTLKNGASLLMNTSWTARGIHRDDIVVFRHNDETFIKRAAYLGGDRIEQIRHRSTDAGWTPVYYPMPGAMSANWEKAFRAVPAGYLFVLSDNPTEDTDSRSLGPIPLTEVEGVITGSRPNPNEWSPGQKTQEYLKAHLAAMRLQAKSREERAPKQQSANHP